MLEFDIRNHSSLEQNTKIISLKFKVYYYALWYYCVYYFFEQDAAVYVDRSVGATVVARKRESDPHNFDLVSSALSNIDDIIIIIIIIIIIVVVVVVVLLLL